MAIAYTRDFLIDAFVSRYECLGPESAAKCRALAEPFYDKVGKDEFRKYASLDAEAIKVYKAKLKEKK